MTPRRIVLVAPFGLRPKGTTTARVLPVASVLATRGAQVRVVIPPWDDPEAAGSRRQEGDIEIVHTRVGTGPLMPTVVMRDLARLVDGFQPDVVHVFKPIGYSGLLAWWRARQSRGNPLLVMDTDDLEGPHGWSKRRSLAFGGWLRGWQEIQTLRAVPRVSVASHWLESFVSTVGVRHDHVFWMPQGWTSGGSGLARGGIDPAEPATLLWYTRFTEVQPVRAAHLFAPLLQADDRRRLLVLGDEIASGARSAAQGAFASAGLADQVEWHPYGDRGLQGLLEERAISLALYPMDDDLANRARCPTKLVELMAASVPVVTEEVGEAQSYLAGFEAECLAPAGDRGGFLSRAKSVLAEPTAGPELGKRLAAAASRFEWREVAGGLLDWYERMAPQRAG